MLTALRNRKCVVGINQLKRAVEADRIEAVYIASDAEQKVIAPLIELCGRKGIVPVRVPSMRELGEACGIQVGASAAGLLSEEQADAQ